MLDDSDRKLGSHKVNIQEYLPIKHAQQKPEEPEINKVTEQREDAKTEHIRNKAFVGLGSCDNVQT